WLRHPLMQLRTADLQMRAHLIAMIERFAGNELTDSPLEPDVLPVPALPRSSNAPALVLSGELDVPRRVQSADRLSVQLRCAERAVITGAGHLPNLDRPDEYSEICRAFLRRHTRRAVRPEESPCQGFWSFTTAATATSRPWRTRRLKAPAVSPGRR